MGACTVAVPNDVWNSHIGCYQVCQKRFDDRLPKGGTPPPGRVLAH